MEININLQDGKYHLKAINEEQNIVEMDGAEQIGGQNQAMRPMQLLLSALGGCSSMDILSILRKQKQEIAEYHVKITGNREKDNIPSLFENIHLHFEFTGNIDHVKIEKAIILSLKKYCSVAKILEKTANITHSYSIKAINSNHE